MPDQTSFVGMIVVLTRQTFGASLSKRLRTSTGNALHRLNDHIRERRKRLEAIGKRKAVFNRSPLKVIVGAGGILQDGWISTEESSLNLLNPDHWRTYFGKRTIDAILAEHVWEHLTLEQGLRAARLCRKYLKPGGYLRVAVPDGNHPDHKYIEHVRPMGTGPGADDHRVLYNYKLIVSIFSKAGFEVKLLEYFDENKKFTFNHWNPDDGMIDRSMRFDERNQKTALTYTSLIIDAFAPGRCVPKRLIG
jgi:predicted SAM-dependent methyltransferase